MSTRAFASDNSSGVHGKVLDAIAAANTGHTPAYGEDPWTADASDAICRAFDHDTEVLFCFGGTGANVIALGAMTRGYHAVLCAENAHLWNSECGAPERFTGAKIMPLPDTDGKLSVATLARHVTVGRGVHNSRPGVLSLTQPTELGTLYTLQQLRELTDFAHANGLLVHVDGARFANAAVALNTSLAELGPRSGIDVLSFGGTKNGLLGAEAVLLFNRDLATEAAYARKQATQLSSKMRFIAAQFQAYMNDDLWRELATQANTMAARLSGHCDKLSGVDMMYPPDCNMLFPRLSPSALSRLHEAYYFYTWDEAQSVARWVTSFDTTADDVDQFAAAIAAACAD